PGRFFVINEVKVLLARVLLKNDVKMADGQDASKSGNLKLSLAQTCQLKSCSASRKLDILTIHSCIIL
ncbi:hypothetical protein M378DRAFT_173687, partial [Amanita muscaria Koide BX008]